MHLKILRAGRLGSGERLKHFAADDRFDDIAEQGQLSTVDSGPKCCDGAAPRYIHLLHREYRA
ncbi:MAG TPA: hypothetical protein VHT21_07700, partial [Stellaceae bacterium]|nr:hypothetical protein [Stellaceae bacterium]